MIRNIIVLLGANQYLRERALAGARQCTSAEVWIADPTTVTNKNRYFDGCLAVSPYDADGIIEQIKNRSDLKLMSVIPLNDWVLKTANEINSYFGLPSLSNRTIERARNKNEMKVQFIENNIPTAKYFLLKEDKELEIAIDRVGLPAVIKPYDFGGSGGVFVAKTFDEAIKYLGESREIINSHKDAFNIKGDKYLIEEYIDSDDEVSVEVICHNGSYKTIAVTEKYLSPKPWFSEMGHLVPSFRNNDTSLRELAENVCEALCIELGMAHVEIKIRDGKYYVIEAAARPGGDGIMDQIEVAFGINPYTLHIGSYLGEDTTKIEIPSPSGTAAIAFLKAKEGKIKSINSDELSKKITNITSIKVTTEVGKISQKPKNWSTREGVVEFYWPEYFEKEKTLLPITEANKISEKIFEIE